MTEDPLLPLLWNVMNVMSEDLMPVVTCYQNQLQGKTSKLKQSGIYENYANKYQQ